MCWDSKQRRLIQLHLPKRLDWGGTSHPPHSGQLLERVVSMISKYKNFLLLRGRNTHKDDIILFHFKSIDKNWDSNLFVTLYLDKSKRNSWSRKQRCWTPGEYKENESEGYRTKEKHDWTRSEAIVYITLWYKETDDFPFAAHYKDFSKKKNPYICIIYANLFKCKFLIFKNKFK